MNSPIRGRRSAFTLIELLVVVAIIALLIGILLPALGEARKSGRITIDQSNLKQLMTACASYATDYKDRNASFTVRSDNRDGSGIEVYPDLYAQAAGDDLRGASAQAVAILRRRAGRDDIDQIDSWIPHVLYNHLVLQDYMASRLPERTVVDPDDRYRLEWQKDPVNYRNTGAIVPAATDDNSAKRWPYSSSYEFVPFWYAPDYGDTITQGSSHRYYGFTTGTGTNILGRRLITDAAFPSQKVAIMNSTSRHFAKRWYYYAHPQARCTLAFFDNSVRIKLTGPAQRYGQNPADANEGGDPSNPSGPFPLTYAYDPEQWEAPKTDGSYTGAGSTDTVMGFYRWTRYGLRGVDFDGKEVTRP